jgi:hypothetical protein
MIDVEKRLTEDLHAALAGEPPLGFDPDEVADRAGRSRRKRRSVYLTASAAAATTALVAVAVTVGSPDDAGRNIGVGTVTAPPNPTSAPAAKPAACQDTPPRKEPPDGFPGSKEVVARLDREVPNAVDEHLPGGAVERSDPMQARDCPPTLVSGYFLGETALALFLIHAQPQLDEAHDRHADSRFERLVDEFTAEDGALVRVYEPTISKPGAPESLSVVRLGTDGMVGDASYYPRDTLAVADVVALLGDPRLHFPIPH